MTDSASRSGRAFLGLAAGAVVVAAAVVGAVVGAAGRERGTTMELLGVVSFPMTPASMAAFGVLTTGTVLAVLFGLVVAVSQYGVEADGAE